VWREGLCYVSLYAYICEMRVIVFMVDRKLKSEWNGWRRKLFA